MTTPEKPDTATRLDQITQVRLTGEQMNALRHEAAQRDDSIGGTVRQLVVAALAELHPDLLGHLALEHSERDRIENALADVDAEQDRQESLQAQRDDFNFPGGSS